MSDNSSNDDKNNNPMGAVEDGVANQGQCSLLLGCKRAIRELIVMPITEINKLAGDIGGSSALDGILYKEADQYIGGTESTGSNANNEGVANTVEDGMVNQGQSLQFRRRTLSLLNALRFFSHQES